MPMKSFHQLLEKQTKKVIGLMSGTSVDGVDVVLVDIHGHGLATQIELLAFESFPFAAETRARIFELFNPETSRVDEICKMNFLMGEIFGNAVLALIEGVQLSIDEIDLIGSHGQTIYHLPPETGRSHVPSTLQIGEPAVIAHRTGTLTIADFRVADVAAGGHGAPLVPYVDFLLFRQEERTIALQNIGGISNVTLIPAGADASDVIASDTGPGNMIIDGVMTLVTDGKQRYDASGQFALHGRVCESMLKEWLAHPFFSAKPPKTTGREVFGTQFARRAFEQASAIRLSAPDLVATVTAFTARTIFDYYDRFLRPNHSLHEINISGGGIHNITLMQQLKDLFHPIPVQSIDTYRIPSDAKEAIAFAILANEAVHGNPTNLPQVTGASGPKILGKFVLP